MGKTKNCKYCGNSFKSSIYHIFYCSEDCERKALNDRWRERKRIESSKRHKKNRQLLSEKLGNECIICHKTKRIVYHEIHGKPHERKSCSYQLKHLKDFIPLCYRCHQTLHYLFKQGIDPNSFVFFLNLLVK